MERQLGLAWSSPSSTRKDVGFSKSGPTLPSGFRKRKEPSLLWALAGQARPPCQKAGSTGLVTEFAASYHEFSMELKKNKHFWNHLLSKILRKKKKACHTVKISKGTGLIPT